MLETLPLPEADDLLDVSSLPPPSVAPCPVMAEAEASLEAPAAAEEEDFRRKQLAVRAEEGGSASCTGGSKEQQGEAAEAKGESQGPTTKD